MNKKLTIAFIGFFLFVLVLFIISQVFLNQKKTQTQTINGGTPTPIVLKKDTTPFNKLVPTDYPQLLSPTISMPLPSTGQNLFVTTADPHDGETNIPANQIITVTFNRPLSIDEASFEMVPPTPVTKKVQGNQLIIIPTKNLQSKTAYIFSVLYSKGGSSRTFTFITEGSGQVKTTAPDQSSEQIGNDYDRQHNPDVFLHNQTPYATDKFSITSGLSDTTGYYAFRVQLSGNPDQAKQAVINWLHSLQLKDDQIQKLAIQYF